MLELVCTYFIAPISNFSIKKQALTQDFWTALNNLNISTHSPVDVRHFSTDNLNNQMFSSKQKSTNEN